MALSPHITVSDWCVVCFRGGQIRDYFQEPKYNVSDFNPKRLHTLSHPVRWTDLDAAADLMGFVSQSQTRFIRNSSSCQKSRGSIRTTCDVNRDGTG